MSLYRYRGKLYSIAILSSFLIFACAASDAGLSQGNPLPAEKKPLITTMYTADPSAHVFNGKIYIYPSHDIPTNVPQDNWGANYDMKDYHVFSLTDFSTPVVDNGEALNVKDVPWASKQMWAPDAAYKNGKYYLFFPAKDKQGIFRVGVATSASPSGSFKAEPEPIKGSYSMDPCAFVDDDGQAYLYFGGLMGGQLERWQTGAYIENAQGPNGREKALGPRVALLTDDLLSLKAKDREIVILNEDGTPARVSQQDRLFFEAAWMFKYKGKYYFTYSTGYSRCIAYAIGDSPLGPFTYKGTVLGPVIGWTNHHSIVEFKGEWYLFYHDASLSGGKDNMRCVKYQKMTINADGTIKAMTP